MMYVFLRKQMCQCKRFPYRTPPLHHRFLPIVRPHQATLRAFECEDRSTETAHLHRLRQTAGALDLFRLRCCQALTRLQCSPESGLVPGSAGTARLQLQQHTCSHQHQTLDEFYTVTSMTKTTRVGHRRTYRNFHDDTPCRAQTSGFAVCSTIPTQHGIQASGPQSKMQACESRPTATTPRTTKQQHWPRQEIVTAQSINSIPKQLHSIQRPRLCLSTQSSAAMRT